MSRLGVLLWKEWRDHRPLLGLAFVLTTALVVLADTVLHMPLDWPSHGRALLPALHGLFLVVLAADVGTRDHQDGAAETLGRLPGSWRATWVPRAVLLAASGAAHLAWLGGLGLVLDDPLLDGARREGLSAFLGRGQEWALAWVVLGVLAAGALVRRPVPAILLGVAWVALVPVALEQLPWAGVPGWVRFTATHAGWTGGALSQLLVVSLALAALVSTTPWARRGVRDALRALGTLAAVLGTTATAAAVHLALELRLEPGDPEVRIVDWAASPDGRWLALEVEKEALLGTRHLDQPEVWFVDRRTTEVRRVDRRPRRLLRALPQGLEGSPWTADGTLLTRCVPEPFSPEGSDRRGFERLDPVARRVVEELRSEARFRAARGVDWCEVRTSRGVSHLVDHATGREVRSEEGRILVSAIPGLALVGEGGHLWRRDLRNGDEHDLGPVPVEWRTSLLPDGEHLLGYADGRFHVVDARTGRELATTEHTPRFDPSPEVVVATPWRWLDRQGRWHDLLSDRAPVRYPLLGTHWLEVHCWRVAEVDRRTGERRVLYGPGAGEEAR